MKFPNRKIQIAIISVGSLSLTWLAAWFAVGSGIPSGISVSGIDIGGKTKVAAISDLKFQMSKKVTSWTKLHSKYQIVFLIYKKTD